MTTDRAKAIAFANKLAQTPRDDPLSIGEYEDALSMLLGSHLCATAPDLHYVRAFLLDLYADVAGLWRSPHFIDRRAETLTQTALATAMDAAAAGKAPR